MPYDLLKIIYQKNWLTIKMSLLEQWQNIDGIEPVIWDYTCKLLIMQLLST